MSTSGVISERFRTLMPLCVTDLGRITVALKLHTVEDHCRLEAVCLGRITLARELHAWNDHCRLEAACDVS